MTILVLNPIIDTHLRESSPTGAHASLTYLTAGVSNSGSYTNILVKFPLSQVPYGAKIRSVKLALYQNDRYNTGLQVQAHRLLRDWDALATWQTVDGSTPWDTYGAQGAGVDVSSVQSGYFISGSTNYIYYEMDLDIDEFNFMREQNFGYRVVNTPNIGYADMISSYNSLEAGSNLPKLTVEYDALLDPIIC